MMIRISFLLLMSLSAVTTAAQTWDVPLDTLEAWVDRQPDDAEARRALADRHLAEGALAAAIPHLRWLVVDAPEDSGRHLQLAQTLSWSGQSREAIEAYDALLVVAPAHDTATFELAKLLIWNGGAERAAELLEPRAEHQPDNAEVQSLYAYALHGAMRPEDALRQYDRALRLSPNDATLLAESGALERWEGDWATGRQRVQRALEIGLDDGAQMRAQSLLDGLARETSPRLELAMEQSSDSNGLTRLRTPSHLHIQFSPAWSAGVRISQERLEQTVSADAARPVIDAAATFVSPYVSLALGRGLSVRAYAGLQDIHNEGSGPSGTAEVAWRRTAPRYLSVLGRLQSEAGVDGVRALGDGIRITVGTVESYMEPRPGWGIGISLKGTSYSDDNSRFEVSSSTRLGISRIGAFHMGVLGGAGYEDTATLYPGSDPYWTPNDLLTVLGGGWVSVTPVSGVTVEPEVYTTFQRDPNVHSLSLGFRVRASVSRGRHQAGVLIEQSGSNAYSVKRAGLRYGVSLW